MKFPRTLFVSVASSGEDAYLDASETEEGAIKATEDEHTAQVAEYQLVRIRKRTIVTSVKDAD